MAKQKEAAARTKRPASKPLAGIAGKPAKPQVGEGGGGGGGARRASAGKRAKEDAAAEAAAAVEAEKDAVDGENGEEEDEEEEDEEEEEEEGILFSQAPAVSQAAQTRRIENLQRRNALLEQQLKEQSAQQVRYYNPLFHFVRHVIGNVSGTNLISRHNLKFE